MLARGPSGDASEPEVGPLERGLVVPPFPERLHEIGDGRTANLGLDVVPRRSRAERGVEHLGLRVAFMALVVATPVAKVDATDGVRVSTADGWWLLRASNTQDVLVARAEASDEAGIERLMAQIDDQLAKSGVKRVEAAH